MLSGKLKITLVLFLAFLIILYIVFDDYWISSRYEFLWNVSEAGAVRQTNNYKQPLMNIAENSLEFTSKKPVQSVYKKSEESIAEKIHVRLLMWDSL